MHQDSYSATSLIHSYMQTENTRQKHYTIGELDKEIVQCHGFKTKENDKQRKRNKSDRHAPQVWYSS